MKFIYRYCVIFFAIVILFSLVPFQAFAVDPVSAGVMANAFAQAIASYGAANGVALTFDVSSTDGIGESVHELWKRFREGQQTADDYATIAQAIFPELYYKTSTAIATASDAVAVGVHISSEYAEELDNFYNWLLSGPAEMVQVDNQYYQFSQAQIGENAQSITVESIYSSTQYPGQPITQIGSFTNMNRWNSFVMSGPTPSNSSPYPDYALIAAASSGSTAYVCFIRANNHYEPVAIFPSSSNMSARFQIDYGGSRKEYSSVFPANQYQNTSWYYSDYLTWSSGWHDCIDATVAYSSVAPVFSDIATAIYQLGLSVDPVVTDSVGVKAYDNSGLASFPDTADPNYDALNRAKDIPLNIPWDDAIYGDGSGTLTDAESAAIAGDLTQALETDRTVELVEEQDIPIQPDYSDVLLPLIPINVPSFNFSLSGIWHYVRSWVTSLGAWLSMMFSVWGILPYAIVVPVYACLVIVIVLGLYKRFFM